MKLLARLSIVILLCILYFIAMPNVGSVNTYNDAKLNNELLKDPIRAFLDSNKSSRHRKNQIIVNFVVSDHSHFENEFNVHIKNKLDSSHYLIEFNTDEYTLEEILIIFNNHADVAYAEPNYAMELASLPSNEPFYNDLWAFHNLSYGINIAPVWELTLGSSEVVVAVVDSGIDYNHPDIASNIWINTGEIFGNGNDDDGNGYIDDYYGWNFRGNNNDVMDVQGHGTHVGGIIAADINGEGVVGVAPNVKIMPLKVTDVGNTIYLDSVITSITYAINHGVKIFNFSFGGPTYYQSFSNAIANADALFLCAAGNDSNNNDIVPYYPSSYGHSNIISVASHNDAGLLSDFSNYGFTSVDISAPGHNILSTYPLSLTPNGYLPYAFMDGTSMAAPYVSGLAALIWSRNPDYSVSEVKNYILSNAKSLGSLSTKVVTGGIIDAYSSYSALDFNLFDGGSGTENDPYLIGTVEQLNNVRTRLSSSFKLVSNLDLTHATTTAGGLLYNSGSGWLPIGNESNPFTGNFDGEGYVIKGLNINRPEENYVGLFGNVRGLQSEHSNIKNVVLRDAVIIGKRYVGGLVGFAEYTNISKVGNEITISAGDSYTGGIAGYLNGNIDHSYNTGLIQGSTKSGGIVGKLIGNITDAFNMGRMRAKTAVPISESGGIAGVFSGEMRDCYFLGLMNNSEFNFIVGTNDLGIIENVYYLNPYNLNSDPNGIEIAEENIFDIDSYEGFDFNNVWQININSKLPTLRNISFSELTDFSVTENLKINIKRDESSTITVSGHPTSNSRKNYIYASDNQEVATVNIEGVVTPIALGKVKIEVYSLELGISKFVDIEVLIIKGDINNDGNVSITDLVKLSRYLAGIDTISSNYLDNADVNNDGNVTITDLVKLSRYLAGLEEI